jgi:streptogramin lyase
VDGVAYGNDSLWVTNGQNDTVLRLDPNDPQGGRATIHLEAGSKPAGIAVARDGSVWVAESLKGQVARIDPLRMREVATVAMLQGAKPDQVAAGAGFVWVTDTQDNTVFRIDPAARQGTTVRGVGNGPVGIAVAFGSVWVANSRDGTVARIEPRTRAVAPKIPLGRGLSPDRMAVAGGSLWVTVHAP